MLSFLGCLSASSVKIPLLQKYSFHLSIIKYLSFSVPAGFTTYKLTFHITEELTNYQNVIHPMVEYPEYYMCTPYIQSVNDLLRERVGHCTP